MWWREKSPPRVVVRVSEKPGPGSLLCSSKNSFLLARATGLAAYILNLPFDSSCDSWWEASDFLKAKNQTFKAQLKC